MVLTKNNDVGVAGGRAFVKALIQNTRITSLMLPRNIQSMYYGRLMYYLNLNVAGRALVINRKTTGRSEGSSAIDIPQGLWALILARCQNIVPSLSQDGNHYYCQPHDLTLFFLRSCPHIVGTSRISE